MEGDTDFDDVITPTSLQSMILKLVEGLELESEEMDGKIDLLMLEVSFGDTWTLDEWVDYAKEKILS